MFLFTEREMLLNISLILNGIALAAIAALLVALIIFYIRLAEMRKTIIDVVQYNESLYFNSEASSINGAPSCGGCLCIPRKKTTSYQNLLRHGHSNSVYAIMPYQQDYNPLNSVTESHSYQSVHPEENSSVTLRVQTLEGEDSNVESATEVTNSESSSTVLLQVAASHGIAIRSSDISNTSEPAHPGATPLARLHSCQSPQESCPSDVVPPTLPPQDTPIALDQSSSVAPLVVDLVAPPVAPVAGSTVEAC